MTCEAATLRGQIQVPHDRSSDRSDCRWRSVGKEPRAWSELPCHSWSACKPLAKFDSKILRNGIDEVSHFVEELVLIRRRSDARDRRSAAIHFPGENPLSVVGRSRPGLRVCLAPRLNSISLDSPSGKGGDLAGHDIGKFVDGLASEGSGPVQRTGA